MRHSTVHSGCVLGLMAAQDWANFDHFRFSFDFKRFPLGKIRKGANYGMFLAEFCL